MLKTLLTILFSLTLWSVSAQHTVDTFKLYFDLNVAPLSKNIEKKIDLLIYNDKIINGSSIMVIGYADFLGSESYNKNLSMQRAKNVKDYLVKYGINGTDVKVCLGRGEVERKNMTDKDGNPIDRRVDIVVNNQVNRTETIASTLRNRNTSANSGSSSGSKSSSTGARNKRDSMALATQQKTPDIRELTKLKEGQTLLLKNVYFPPGSHVIKPESYETIEKLVKILADNPKLKISIEGHVCCIHDVPDALDIDTNELLLSLNRAKAIYHYLVEKGINETRLQYQGFGRQHPIVAFEKTEEDADRNRRVEIRITSVN